MGNYIWVKSPTYICCGQEHAPVKQQADIAGAIAAILIEKRRSVDYREEEVDMLKVASY